MPDDGNSGGGITPRITRTSSVMPGSRVTTRVSLSTGQTVYTPSGGTGIGPATPGPVPADPRQINRDSIYFIRGGGSGGMASRNISSLVPDGAVMVSAGDGGVYVRFPDAASPQQDAANALAQQQRTARTQQRAQERQQQADQTVAEYRQRQARNNASRQTVDGVAVDPDNRTSDRFTMGTDADGNPVRQVVGANGQMVTDTSSYGARVARQQAAANSVFGTLDAASQAGLTGAEQFILNVGDPIDATTNRTRTSGNQDLRVGGQNASQAPRTPSVNRMTLSGGTDWFRQLASSDQGAYNALVVELRNAGYGGLSNNDAALPLNGYSAQAANAFIEAAADLSASGEQVPLLEWLTRRGQGYADYLAQQASDQAAADAYKPVDRQYDDSDSVKQAAKDAAVQALGRKLTDEEEARFEAHYRSKEDGYFDAIDAAGRAKTAARVENPNLGGSADGFVQGEEYDTERATQALGSYAQVFQKMMGV